MKKSVAVLGALLALTVVACSGLTMDQDSSESAIGPSSDRVGHRAGSPLVVARVYNDEDCGHSPIQV